MRFLSIVAYFILVNHNRVNAVMGAFDLLQRMKHGGGTVYRLEVGFIGLGDGHGVYGTHTAIGTK